MREIRFRAKRQDNGEWIKSGTMVTFNTVDTTAFYLPKSPCVCEALRDRNGNLTALDGVFFLVRADTIGQFIGEQDANGDDIFEGDIVKHGEKMYVIRYNDHRARFIGKNNRSNFAIFPFGNCTIMGNIYDHANLMEAGKCS